ncbi:hypothetical protein LEMLEM_LOCUS25917, partial [Lemmus lemmus]
MKIQHLVTGPCGLSCTFCADTAETPPLQLGFSTIRNPAHCAEE